MYDQDHDGLLSNTELDTFQYQTFQVPLVERDLVGWKKVISQNQSEEQQQQQQQQQQHPQQQQQPGVKDGKFTEAGFLAIFDVFISQNRLDVPWKALRKFGYNDALELQIPPPQDQQGKRKRKLTSSAKHFLVALFHQFDSNKDGTLSAEDLEHIFSILPDPACPPWHPIRVRTIMQGAFSVPKSNTVTIADSATSTTGGGAEETPAAAAAGQDPMALSLTASGITILSSASLPSMGDLSSSSSNPPPVAVQQGPMTLLDWMGHWHMISAISPFAARAELYRLGHVDSSQSRKKRRRADKQMATTISSSSLLPPATTPSISMQPSKEIRLFVFGTRDCGKNSLMRLLCGTTTSTGKQDEGEEENPTPETWCTHIVFPKVDEDDELVIHYIITQVPEASSRDQELASLIMDTKKNRPLVVFLFDCREESSLHYVMRVEKEMLDDGIPRVFVANNNNNNTKEGEEAKMDDRETTAAKETTLLTAQEHCHDLDIETPFIMKTNSKESDRMGLLKHFAGCMEEKDGMVENQKKYDYVKSMPHAEQKKREAARRRKMIWFGSIVSVSVAVAVGVGVLWSRRSSTKTTGRFHWLNLFFGKSSSSSSSQSK